VPEYKTIPLAQIAPPAQPVREVMDDAELEELATSIRSEGILNPLIVIPISVTRETGDGNAIPTERDKIIVGKPLYEIVAGHRRYIAAGLAGLWQVPCSVYSEPGFSALRAKLHENAFREAVNPVEEGHFYCEIAAREGMTEELLAKNCGQKLGYIYSRMELVRGDECVTLAVLKQEINMSVARELNRCADEGHRRYLLKLASEAGATAKQVEMWVYDWKRNQGLIAPQAEPMNPTPQSATVATVLPRCVFCGQDERQYDLEGVYICRAELAALRAAYKAKSEE
jgi:ParB/RepB/Spo0J family partition protein